MTTRPLTFLRDSTTVERHRATTTEVCPACTSEIKPGMPVVIQVIPHTAMRRIHEWCETGATPVFAALEATAYLAGSIDQTANDLLRELGQASGVARGSVRIPTADVRPGRHGLCQVQWTQGGRTLTAEGHTLDVALRRAVRRSERVSAKADVR